MKITDIKKPTIVLYTQSHQFTKTYDEDAFRTLLTLSMSYSQSLYTAIQDTFFALLDSEPIDCQLPILRFEFIFTDSDGYKHIISGNL